MSYAPRRPTQSAAGSSQVQLAKVLACLIWLIVLFTIVFWELSALFGYNGAVNKVDPVELRRQDKTMNRDEFEKFIGKSADGPMRVESGLGRATYSWRGLFRTHRFYAYFESDGNGPLSSVDTTAL